MSKLNVKVFENGVCVDSGNSDITVIAIQLIQKIISSDHRGPHSPVDNTLDECLPQLLKLHADKIGDEQGKSAFRDALTVLYKIAADKGFDIDKMFVDAGEVFEESKLV